MSTKACVGPGQIQEPGTQSRLQCGWQGRMYLNYHLLPFRVYIRRKVESEAEPDSYPATPVWNVGMPNGILTALPNVCTAVNFLKTLHSMN